MLITSSSQSTQVKLKSKNISAILEHGHSNFTLESWLSKQITPTKFITIHNGSSSVTEAICSFPINWFLLYVVLLKMGAWHKILDDIMLMRLPSCIQGIKMQSRGSKIPWAIDSPSRLGIQRASHTSPHCVFCCCILLTTFPSLEYLHTLC